MNHDSTKPGPHNQDGPVHWAFGLTYSAYFCVPRLVLQEMPIAWQEKFIALINELPGTPTYDVRRKDKRMRFIGDPWRDYRRGSVADAKANDPDEAVRRA